MRFAFHALLQDRRKPGLADARLAGNEYDTAFALPYLPPAPEQQFDLLLAADQRGQSGRVERLEPTLDLSLAKDPSDLDRSGQALEIDKAQIAALEQTACELARERVDHDAAGLRESLQPSREVRRLAHDPMLLGHARADQIADHGEPRGNAHPSFQRLPCAE